LRHGGGEVSMMYTDNTKTRNITNEV